MSATISSFPATLEQRIEELNQAREALLKEALSEEDIKPQSGWSISEILFHLHVTEKMFPMLMKQLLHSDKVEKKSDEYLQMEWQFIGQLVSNRRTKINAPDMVKPLNAPSLAESVALLSESRKALLECLAEVTLDELCCLEAQHPVKEVGVTISGPGWISFFAQHELRHLEQIKEIKQNNSAN